MSFNDVTRGKPPNDLKTHLHRHFSKGELENKGMGFPGGAVVKNPPANEGDTVLSPGPGRSHMPWSN